MKDILIAKAKEVAGMFALDNHFNGNSAGAVGAALLSENGNIYTGICLVLECGLGFCAEASAIAEMLKNRETKIKQIVAVTHEGKIIPPCGRCREMLVQVDFANLDTDIIVSSTEIVKLKELLPNTWADKF